MKSITRKEEMIMLAIMALGSDAYLIAIQQYLSEITQKKVSLTSVHLPLSRLEDAMMILGKLGGATAVRGGRRKKIYSITSQGEVALEELKRISDALWNGAAI
ncbi:helix-turn-helix transcriptional regulator [bacterium]|nr:helix-turn-helix transcriptional regulator [bacterium]